jgi:hypothetical protein
VNKKDWAVVFGIRRYPRFGRTSLEPDDLQGPDNDAKAVYDWLVDPGKGGLPPGHVFRVHSANYADPFKPLGRAKPTGQELLEAFQRLEARAEANNLAGRGRIVGRRLYVYAAGHGFAPALKQGSIFTADATREMPPNFFVSSWVDALVDRQYFDEYVLWMDSCMTFQLAVVANPAPYQQRTATGKRRKLFSAFAARKPEEAVEKQMPDGLVHGVFTWTLLQGLNGAAAVNPQGELTTAELKNYMFEAMRTLLTPEELADDRVSSEPDFGSVDQIVLATIPPRLFQVTLLFPAESVGKPLIVFGEGLSVIATGPIPAPTMVLPPLKAGMYAAVVDGTNTGFQVVGDTDVHIG